MTLLCDSAVGPASSGYKNFFFSPNLSFLHLTISQAFGFQELLTKQSSINPSHVSSNPNPTRPVRPTCACNLFCVTLRLGVVVAVASLHRIIAIFTKVTDSLYSTNSNRSTAIKPNNPNQSARSQLPPQFKLLNRNYHHQPKTNNRNHSP